MTDTTNPPTGTIDITNTVESLKNTFVTWAVAYVFGLEVAAPGFEWVATPVIDIIDKEVLKATFNLLANSAIMEAFFLNTAIRKASQAQDYVNAVAIKTNLPTTASEAEYAQAESNEMVAFRNFVLITN